MDPPGRPRRGVRARSQPRAAGRDRGPARHRRGDERRHPRRRVAGGGDGDRLPAGQHRHRGAGDAGVVCAAPSRPGATGSPSGSTSAAGPSPRAAGPARAATSTTYSRRLDAEGCARYVVTDVAKDGMLQGPNLQLLKDVCAETDRPVVASGGITELDDLRALMGLVGDGVEGAIVGTALYEGRFTLTEALELTRPMTPRRSASSRASTSTTAGWSRASTSASCATPATPSSWPRSTTPRAPTSSRSSTSPPPTRAAPPPSRWSAAPPSRSSSRSRSAAASRAPTTSTPCCAPVPTRSPSTPPPSTGPSSSPRSPTGSATRCWCSRSTRAARRDTDSGFEVTTHGGRKSAGLDAIAWARRACELGAGEILLNAMDADGTREGFDLDLIRGRTPRGHRPRDRERRRGRGRALPAGRRRRRRRRAGGQRLPLRHAGHRRTVEGRPGARPAPGPPVR